MKSKNKEMNTREIIMGGFLFMSMLGVGFMLLIALLGGFNSNKSFQETNNTKVIVDVSFPIEIPMGAYISQEGVRMSMCPEEANKLLLTQGGIYVSQEGIVDILIK